MTRNKKSKTTKKSAPPSTSKPKAKAVKPFDRLAAEEADEENKLKSSKTSGVQSSPGSSSFTRKPRSFDNSREQAKVAPKKGGLRFGTTRFSTPSEPSGGTSESRSARGSGRLRRDGEDRPTENKSFKPSRKISSSRETERKSSSKRNSFKGSESESNVDDSDRRATHRRSSDRSAKFSGRPTSQRGQNVGRDGYEGSSHSGEKTTSNESAPSLIGVVKRHPDGFGFLVPDDVSHPDVYIPKHSMAGVMTNDKVEAKIFPSRKGDRFFGEIEKIVQRNTKQVTGRLNWLNEREAVIQDESKTWGASMRVFKENAMGAAEGEYVAAEVIVYPSSLGDFTGRVTKRIGDSSNPLNDVKRVIAIGQVPEGFSRQAMDEAAAYGLQIQETDLKDRKDLRELAFVTIDGATARDFDDAIYVEQTDLGFHAYVAIADVSHYVKEGSALDREAYEKGNSTYFPGYVVPMLPENLSNVLCSLNPHVDRLSLVADMHLDFQGDVLHANFYEAVINSHARVTYGEAQEIVDGNIPEQFEAVANDIKRAADLSRMLMAKRFREGSLDLDIPSTEVLLDSNGEPVDLVRSERIFAHRLIEELMLLANVSVAKYLTEKEIPSLFRIHEPPKMDNIEYLQRYLNTFGSARQITGDGLQKKLTRALQEFAGKPESQVLNILTLRSMSQAKYSADNIGHFGLGFSHYTHFTSPIRRYADLVVHRLIKSAFMKEYSKSRRLQDELQTIGTMISACEQRSVKAERLLISIKKARFMHKFLGQEFEGVISSVAKFGIFVLLRQFDVDGLVKLDDLGGEAFEFDEQNVRLVGRRSGFQFLIGDTVKVQVARVNIEEGQIDFVLVQEEGKSESDQHSETDRQDIQKRGSSEDDSGDVRKVRVPRRTRKNKTRK